MLSPMTLAGAATRAVAPAGPATHAQPARVLSTQAATATPPMAPAPPKTAPAATPQASPTRTMPRGSLLDMTV